MTIVRTNPKNNFKPHVILERKPRIVFPAPWKTDPLGRVLLGGAYALAEEDVPLPQQLEGEFPDGPLLLARHVWFFDWGPGWYFDTAGHKYLEKGLPEYAALRPELLYNRIHKGMNRHDGPHGSGRRVVSNEHPKQPPVLFDKHGRLAPNFNHIILYDIYPRIAARLRKGEPVTLEEAKALSIPSRECLLKIIKLKQQMKEQVRRERSARTKHSAA